MFFPFDLQTESVFVIFMPRIYLPVGYPARLHVDDRVPETVSAPRLFNPDAQHLFRRVPVQFDRPVFRAVSTAAGSRPLSARRLPVGRQTERVVPPLYAVLRRAPVTAVAPRTAGRVRGPSRRVCGPVRRVRRRVVQQDAAVVVLGRGRRLSRRRRRRRRRTGGDPAAEIVQTGQRAVRETPQLDLRKRPRKLHTDARFFHIFSVFR